MGDDQPGDHEIEQENGIDGQRLAILWLAVAEEYVGGVRGPHKAHDCGQESQSEQ